MKKLIILISSILLIIIIYSVHVYKFIHSSPISSLEIITEYNQGDVLQGQVNKIYTSDEVDDVINELNESGFSVRIEGSWHRDYNYRWPYRISTIVFITENENVYTKSESANSKKNRKYEIASIRMYQTQW